MQVYKNYQNVIIRDLGYYILKIGKPVSEATNIGKILKQNGIRNMREFVMSDEEEIFRFKGIGKRRKRTIALAIKAARKDNRMTLWSRINKARFDTDVSDLHSLKTIE